jgi:hypothetical protein
VSGRRAPPASITSRHSHRPLQRCCAKRARQTPRPWSTPGRSRSGQFPMWRLVPVARSAAAAVRCCSSAGSVRGFATCHEFAPKVISAGPGSCGFWIKPRRGLGRSMAGRSLMVVIITEAPEAVHGRPMLARPGSRGMPPGASALCRHQLLPPVAEPAAVSACWGGAIRWSPTRSRAAGRRGHERDRPTPRPATHVSGRFRKSGRRPRGSTADSCFQRRHLQPQTGRRRGVRERPRQRRAGQ